MTHEMHLVEGFILDSSLYGESGRILKILTRDYGVMSVVATGVRELKSKMRGSMDTMQIVHFEFVVGREVNRLIGIHEQEKFSNIFSGKDVIAKRRVVSNVINFVLRTVVGETRNENLWNNFLDGIRLLNEDEKRDFQSLEIIWLIKILVSLGYWQSGRYDEFTDENFKHFQISENKSEIIEEINNSIKSTHL